jgi:hypothetical protein
LSLNANLFTPVPNRSETPGSPSVAAAGLAQSGQGIPCPNCGGDVTPTEPPNRWQECPYCEKRVLLRVWSIVRQSTNAASATPEQATCFFHPEKAFQACCQRCGRFVCALCDLQLGAEHVCPTCFERGRADTGLNGGKAEWRTRDVLYDSIAVNIGWGWLLVWPIVVVALPAVVVLHIKYRKAPYSYLIPRSGWRFWAAYAGFAWLPLLIGGVMLAQRITRGH